MQESRHDPMTYFVLHSFSGDIKIGLSIDPGKRVRSLQTASSRKLELIGTIDGDRESELHKRFAKCRVRGEWFHPTPALKNYILNESGISFTPEQRTRIASLTPIEEDEHSQIAQQRRESLESALSEQDSSTDPVGKLCAYFWTRQTDSEYWLPGETRLEYALDEFPPIGGCNSPADVERTRREVAGDQEPWEPYGEDCECEICTWLDAVNTIDECRIVRRVGINEERQIFVITHPINGSRRKAQLDFLSHAWAALDWIYWDILAFAELTDRRGTSTGFEEIDLQSILHNRISSQRSRLS